MEMADLLNLLLSMLQSRHTHSDPAEQKECDKALVMATVAVMMAESEATLAQARNERATDALLRQAATNPHVPKA